MSEIDAVSVISRISCPGATPWQRYGYDHVLRDEEKTLVVARYILQNPLRAGLVKRIEDYPFVGSLEWPLEVLLDWISKQ